MDVFRQRGAYLVSECLISLVFFCSGTDIIIHTRGGVHVIIGSVSFPPLSIDCCPDTDTFDTNKIFMDIFYTISP